MRRKEKKTKKISQPHGDKKTKNEKNTPRTIKRVETESDKSSEDEESIRKMIDRIKIH